MSKKRVFAISMTVLCVITMTAAMHDWVMGLCLGVLFGIAFGLFDSEDDQSNG